MTNQLKNQKNQLAKLMATENLTIVHKKVPTAYFDMKNRILCCPIFKDDLSKELYDLFMGHEVGHALNTPYEGVHSALTKNKTLKGYLNVVEDVRIEKDIKNRYAGLRKSFFTAYNELMEMDFFGIKKRDLQALSLIDKINLITKVGHRVNIKLNSEEAGFLQMAEDCKTWDDVEICANAIYDWSKENETRDENDEALVPQTIQFTDEDDMEDEDGEEMDSDFGEDSSDDEDWDGNGTSTKDGDEGDDEDDSMPDVDAFGKDSAETDENAPEGKGDVDGGDEGDQKSNDKKMTGKEGGVGSSDDYDGEHGARESITEHHAHNNEDMFISESNTISTTVNLKDQFKKRDQFSGIVVPYKKMIADWTPFWESKSDDIYGDSEEKIAKRLIKATHSSKKLKDKNKKIVQHMAKEFEMKQTAMQSAKAFQGKTGKLDMTKLAKYQIVDDIFKKVTYFPDGKNHGLQVLLDWSGSIASECSDLIEQTMILVDFCRKVNIPHRVYLFSDVYYDAINGEEQDTSYFTSREPRLIELFSDKMSTREFNKNHINVAHLFNQYHFERRTFKKQVELHNSWFGDIEYIDLENTYGWYDFDSYSCPRNYRLGGTPLDHCLTAMRLLIPLFNEEYGIEKSILTVITDGYSHRSPVFDETDDEREDKKSQEDPTEGHSWRIQRQRYLIDPITNRSYLYTDSDGYNANNFVQSQNILDWIAKETGVIVTGYFVLGNKNDFWGLHNNIEEIRKGDADSMWKECRKNGLCVETHGYGKLFLTTSSALSVAGEDSLDDDLVGANKRRLLSAFKKNQNSKTTSRFLTNEFIKEIA